MLQIKTGGNSLTIIEWGISFDGSSAATPIEVELVVTGTVNATMTTATVASGIQALNLEATLVTSTIAIGSTAATGFNASAEGSTTATRSLDSQLIAPTGQYIKQYPLGREPQVQGGGQILRVRVTAGTAVNAWAYINLQE
jgi:hypothetical protein